MTLKLERSQQTIVEEKASEMMPGKLNLHPDHAWQNYKLQYAFAMFSTYDKCSCRAKAKRYSNCSKRHSKSCLLQ